MKVTLEKGETLDVALVEDDRIVGTLSLQLRGVGSGAAVRAVSDYSRRAAEAPAEPAAGTTRTGRRKRQISAEARAKMAEAQRRRWEKYRQGKAK